MKYIILAVTIATLAFTPLFSAQDPPPPQLPPPVENVARYFDLSSEQVEAWIGLMEELKNQNRPIMDQIRQKEIELKELLQGENPDPATAGALFLQIHNLKGELARNEMQYRQAFGDLLNEEQKQKMGAVHIANRLQPLLPAFHDLKLI